MSKYKLLIIGLIIDGLGILTSSWILPLVGDFADIVWAPLSAWIMTKMYKGNSGKIAGAVTFIEELLPGIDIIPSFTLMWIYTYVIAKKEVNTTEKDSDIIDIT
ncbi:hypothetical protein GCM10011344_43940 [Dokdonia pacifica]|uniref:Uncharacterized protein n=1 Tax=Dokdonia pacifica TaxID=1627892 RepID=A0A239CJN5_9FLAO|nr:hypothetical protein [Dokdonia pacifica]GGG38301.1 hypothetical protein GCM10011344_43940 [Dokdonia pacifica]SNS19908.1 hypothetical protein SAMN06265376_10819 [Dokdonia pacifica]